MKLIVAMDINMTLHASSKMLCEFEKFIVLSWLPVGNVIFIETTDQI